MFGFIFVLGLLANIQQIIGLLHISIIFFVLMCKIILLCQQEVESPISCW